MASIVNFYERIPSKYKPKQIDYKSKDKLQLSLCLRACCIGSSGSMKTNFVCNLIAQIGAFNKIFLFVKDPTESLYKFLIDHFQEIEKKVKEPIIFFSNDPSEIPDYEFFDPKYNNLCIFDDLINEKSKDLQNVANLYTMGRKRNVSSIFISQSYFQIPKIIRQNTDVLFILKVNTVRDLHRILSEYQLEATREQIEKMYKIATRKKGDVFTIDVANQDPNLRYRHNFTGFKLPDSENYDDSENYEEDN